MERLKFKDINEWSTTETISRLKTSTSGISDIEAQRRQAEFGLNVIQKPSRGFFRILIRQFNNAIIYLLLVADIMAFAAGSLIDGYVISIILIINALLGFTQEYRSELAIEKIASLIKNHVLLLRNGNETVVTQDQLVPGDVIILKEGDITPADCRILSCDSFTVDESLLTGESAIIFKQAKSSKSIERQTIVFAGSTIKTGEATLVVFATGNETELGKIAHLSSATHRLTQYEKSFQSLSSILIKLTVILIPIIFIIKIFVLHDYVNLSDNIIFMFAFAIAVVPEALPAIITIALSTKAIKLAKKSVVVKRLSAIEDIGNITVLCTDKTGTLTENKLTISGIVSDQPDWLQILAYACSDFIDPKRKKLASSYDVAFNEYVPENLALRAQKMRKIKELPFSPEARRRRIVLEDTTDGKNYLVEIGSAETIIAMCDHCHKKDYLQQITKDGTKGIRHLGIAAKEIDKIQDFNILKHENELEFIGFVQLIDPLKKTAKSAVRLAKDLGIEVKILTGDSKEVARYIAEQVGLIKPDEKIYTGEELDSLTIDEMKIAIKSKVFARITPEQKYKIIEMLKRTDVVAYQGDGINDAPSLALADVAIAVNTATDVARDSADILLLKSDMNIIIQAISDGRAVFSNINKYIRYTMIGNFSSFFTLAVLYLSSGSELPLLPIQLLVVSSFTQLPLIAIASDSVEKHSLRQPSHYDIQNLIFVSLFLGLFTTMCQLLFFATIHSTDHNIVQTSLFLFLFLVQIIVIFSVRNTACFLRSSRPSIQLLISVGLSCLLAISMLYTRPIQSLIGVVPLPIENISFVILMTIFYFIIIDILKIIYYRIATKIHIQKIV